MSWVYQQPRKHLNKTTSSSLFLSIVLPFFSLHSIYIYIFFLSLLSYASSSLSTSLFLHFLFFFLSSLLSGAVGNESKRWVRFIAQFFLFVYIYIYIYFFFSLIAFLCIFFTFHVPFPSFFLFLFVLSTKWCWGEWQ